MLPRIIELSTFRLRPWQATDGPSLVRHANDREIWRNLWDVFPHPYTAADADKWLRIAAAEPWPEGLYAIEVDGEAAGVLSLARRHDIERFSAEIGYWLGRAGTLIDRVMYAKTRETDHPYFPAEAQS